VYVVVSGGVTAKEVFPVTSTFGVVLLTSVNWVALLAIHEIVDWSPARISVGFGTNDVMVGAEGAAPRTVKFDLIGVA
jgi:hypothetical protein